jgi:LysM repeat protein
MYNKKLHHTIIPLLAFTCLSLNVFADEIQLKKDHPHRHVVVKGDTLWDISAKFLKDPWLWPKLWGMNRDEIRNPHLIYPGEVVILDLSGGDPRLRLLHETVKLEPSVRVEPLEKEAIQTISPNVITPFLTQPLLIENDDLATAPRIIAGPDNRVIMSPGTRVYINDVKEENGANWDVYRPGEQFVDPDTKEILGTEAIYLGDLNVVRFGAPASADILNAKEEIFVKDRLVIATDEIRDRFVPHAPEKQVKGRILRIYGGVAGGVAEAGPNSVVAINLGTKDGLEVGHVLAVSRYGRIIQDPEYKPTGIVEQKPALKELNFDVSRDENGAPIVNFAKEPVQKEPILAPGQVKLPDERVGLLMVFRTFDRVSYGLIMRTSNAIFTLDAVQTP